MHSCHKNLFSKAGKPVLKCVSNLWFKTLLFLICAEKCAPHPLKLTCVVESATLEILKT